MLEASYGFGVALGVTQPLEVKGEIELDLLTLTDLRQTSQNPGGV